MMRTILLTSSALALVASLTAAQAQSTVPGRAQVHSAQNTTQAPPTVGAPMVKGAPATPERISTDVMLTDDQRVRISAILASERGNTTSVTFQLTAGTPVPTSVTLKSVPPEVATVAHEYSGKSFFVTPDSIVIVNPADRQIVTAFSFLDRETALVPTVSKNIVTLSPAQREMIRHEVAPGSATGPAPLVRPRVAAAGDEVPASIALKDFPAAVSSTVPQIRTYRYYLSGQDVVIVDPDKRRVLDVIQ